VGGKHITPVVNGETVKKETGSSTSNKTQGSIKEKEVGQSGIARGNLGDTDSGLGGGGETWQKYY